jgi:hypothetical protein
MKRMRFAAVLAATTVLSAGFAPAALAADDTSVTVSSGTLAITADPTAPDFSGVTLDGTAKQTTTTLSTFEVNDSRGTGAGWNVTVSATQFKEHDGTAYVTGGKTLPTGSLSMAAPTVAADGTTSPVPTLTAGPYTIDGASVKIASASADTGMGKYDFSSSALTLTVPSSAYAKGYRSSLTVTLATGP